jgi:hypothetical protein
MKNSYRLCEVKGKICYFHGWEHKSRLVDASPMIGGHPGGLVEQHLAIVEYPDGCIHECYPDEVRFCDETHCFLSAMEEHYAKKEANK